MTKQEAKKLADKITEDIFALGSEPGKPCSRIAFKSWHNGAEKEQGGMCREALLRFIQGSIRGEGWER